MDLTAVLASALFLTVLASQTSCSSTAGSRPKRETSPDSTTTQGCVLPQPPHFGSYTSPVCQYDNTSAACKGEPGTAVPHNWMLSFSCNEGYYLEGAQDSVNATCVNGNWSPRTPICQVCGKKNSGATVTESPWHVALYRKIEEDQWQQICLGTLISSHIVLTAGQCVFDEQTRQIIPASEIKLGLGKHYEPHSVKVDVREISIPPHYFGRVSNYADDMALLDLKNSVLTHTSIMPACFDWNHKFIITPGITGTVTGWSRTENGTVRSTVSDTQLKYIDYQHCIFDVPPAFRQYVVPEKFCAEHHSGVDIRAGHGGGGLTFEKNGSHYVLGVASVTFKSHSPLVLFSNVTDSRLLSWLIQVKRTFDEAHTTDADHQL